MGVVGLLAADDKLVVFDGDAEISHCEPGNGERNAERIFLELFYIVRWDSRRSNPC